MCAWQQHEAELRGRLGNDAYAEDQLQDLFLKAWRQVDRFCSIDNARAWLFEAERNAIAARLRVSRQMVEVPEDLAAETVERAVFHDLTACLPRVLSELGPDDREAIALCDLEGVTQQDLARRKGLTLAGAKSRAQRARKRLREQLTQVCPVDLDASGQVFDFVPRTPAS